VLRDAHLLDAPQTFFCPSETDPQWEFGTPQNPWPFVTVASPTATHTRIRYGTRPRWSWKKTGAWPDPMPRLVKLKDKAITADLLIGPDCLLNEKVTPSTGVWAELDRD
jgi:hypothetical protein